MIVTLIPLLLLCDCVSLCELELDPSFHPVKHSVKLNVCRVTLKTPVSTLRITSVLTHSTSHELDRAHGSSRVSRSSFDVRTTDEKLAKAMLVRDDPAYWDALWPYGDPYPLHDSKGMVVGWKHISGPDQNIVSGPDRHYPSFADQPSLPSPPPSPALPPPASPSPPPTLVAAPTPIIGIYYCAGVIPNFRYLTLT